MTAPGDGNVGSIVAYLSLNRSDWSRGVDETERDSNRLGRLSPNIRIQTNAGEVVGQLALVQAAERKVGTDADKAKPFVVNLWAALAAIAPAAVPIAGVLGGAFVGAIPLVATLALGLSGINDELKSGQLEGTQFGADLNSVSAEAQKLKAIAAGGLLAGLHTGLAESHGLFEEVNGDVGMMSGQLGDIAGATAPALLRVLTQLNPLFVTFGNLVDQGAHRLDAWSKNSTGVESFVAYVQTEAPAVMSFFGNLITLVTHLAEASAGTGGVMLGELSLLVHVLNAIPVGVLQAAIPVVISLYAAFKTYGAVTALIAGVNSAVESMTTPFATSAAAAQASSLATQAAVAEEAAAVARAKAAEAEATAEAAVEIAASVEGTSSVLAGGASAAAESAIEFAAAMQAEADAATAAAVEIGAAATAAAETVAAEGEAASVGWSAMLGPLAAVGIGLAFLVTAFTGSSSSAEAAARIQNSYADSLRKTTDALADVNIQTTNKNLSDDHALANLDALAKSNSGLTLSYNDLALAVNGSQAQFDKVHDSLMAVADANKNVVDTSAGYAARGPSQAYNDTGTAAVNLLGKIKALRDGLDAQTKTQLALNEANREAQQLQDGGASAAGAAARQLGVTTQAYLDAQLAAKKNTDQTNAQDLAFRRANDGGSLLALTLDKLSGKKLDYQQALNAFQQQLVSGGPKGTAGKAADVRLTGMSEAAVNNRGDLIAGVQSAEQAAETLGKQSGSTEKARAELVRLRKALIDSRVARGEDRAEVVKFVDSILTIPPAVAQANKTVIDLQTDAAQKRLADFRAHLIALQKGVKVPITVSDPSLLLLTIQKHIDSIHGKQVVIDAISTVAGGGFNVQGGAGKQARAGGGEIFGAGPKGVDSVDVYAAPGEFMMSNAAVDRYGLTFMKSINAGTLKLPAASPVARAATPASSAGSSVAGSRSVHIDKFEQHFHYPEPEEPSRTTSRSMEAAAYVLSDI